MSDAPRDGIEVEQGIPIPDPQRTSYRKYPWASLVNEGTNFFVPMPDDKNEADSIRRSVYTAGTQWVKRNRPGHIVVSRKVVRKHDGKRGVRFWIMPKGWNTPPSTTSVEVYDEEEA